MGHRSSRRRREDEADASGGQPEEPPRRESDQQAGEPASSVSRRPSTGRAAGRGVQREAGGGEDNGAASGRVAYDPGSDPRSLGARHGLEVGRREARRLRRLEAEFGRERVSRWADEGVPVEAMGRPRDMESFRERQPEESRDTRDGVGPGNEASRRRDSTSRPEETPGSGDEVEPDRGDGDRAPTEDTDIDHAESSADEGGPGSPTESAPTETLGPGPEAAGSERAAAEAEGGSGDGGRRATDSEAPADSPAGGDGPAITDTPSPATATATETAATEPASVEGTAAEDRSTAASGSGDPPDDDDGITVGRRTLRMSDDEDGTAGRVDGTESDSPTTNDPGDGEAEVNRVPEPVQPKLAVSSPDDPAEREAEAVAERIVGADDPASVSISESVAGRGAGGEVGEGRASVVRDGVRGSGKPLPSGLRSTFEATLGADLSSVGIHTGAAADRAARSIDAEAYTMGPDIAFASGNYDPASRAGRRLLAHELTHVVQNGASRRASRVLRQVEVPDERADLGEWIAYGADGRDLLELVEEADQDQIRTLATSAIALSNLYDELSKDQYLRVCERLFDAGARPSTVVAEIEGSLVSDLEYKQVLYDYIYDEQGGENLDYETKKRMLAGRIGGSVTEDIDPIELQSGTVGTPSPYSTERQKLLTEEGRREIRAEGTRLASDTLDEIYEAVRIAENSLGRSIDLDEIELFADAENAEGRYRGGSADVDDDEIDANILHPEDARYNFLHEIAHLADDAHEGNNFSLAGAMDEGFSDISGWKEHDDPGALVNDKLTADSGGVSDPYDLEADEGGSLREDVSDFESSVRTAAVSVVRHTMTKGEATQDVVGKELEDAFGSSAGGSDSIPVPRLVETVRMAQASESPWEEEQFAKLEGRYEDRIYHQGYPAGYPNPNWWSYDRGAREHMLTEYAMRTPQEEFAEALAHAVDPSRAIEEPYRSYIVDNFGDEIQDESRLDGNASAE